MRNLTFAVVMAAALTATPVVAGDASFVARVVEYASTVPLGVATADLGVRPGLPPNRVKFRIVGEVENVSEKAVPAILADSLGYRHPREFSIFTLVRKDTGEDVEPCWPTGFSQSFITGVGSLPSGWKKRLELPVCVPGPGTYSVRVVAEQHSPLQDSKDRSYTVWDGVVMSDEVKIEVTRPEGIDKEAYEAFGHNPLGDSERWGELLRRFPTSTYAAYLVWTRWGRVTAGVWKSAGDRDKFLAWLSGDPDQEYLTWNLPCAEDGRTDGAVTTRLGGRKALACRDRWLELVLDHHPDIWFADEVLLRLALDRYRLADKDACAAGLADLAEHGKPYVASKAGELLSAIRAKGMLPEKAK